MVERLNWLERVLPSFAVFACRRLLVGFEEVWVVDLDEAEKVDRP